MELHTYLGVPMSQNKEDSMAKKARSRHVDANRIAHVWLVDRITKFGTRRRRPASRHLP